MGEVSTIGLDIAKSVFQVTDDRERDGLIVAAENVAGGQVLPSEKILRALNLRMVYLSK
jgi:hypothetical protein